VSSVLVLFNEILEKGFDGHNFIDGLNNHLRDLLVCRDEVTIPLLETPASVRQRYLMQTERCAADFLFSALEAGTSCDLSYKAAINQRLHVELALIRLCRLTTGNDSPEEKKKSDLNEGTTRSESVEEEIPLPSKSVILQQPDSGKVSSDDNSSGKHIPVIEKPAKTFSIKDIIADDRKEEGNRTEHTYEAADEDTENGSKESFSPETFEESWKEFIGQLDGEGPRIVSMFKTIRPEFEDDQTIRVHLSNATQKDTFVLNYKQRLIGFLQKKFILPEIEIETIVDVVETDDILYTDEQRYNYLFNKYPVLKEMKKNFNLDIT
jgi:DNA polymerase-3 subunit gamma/tau